MLQNIYLIQIIFIKSIENLLSYNEKKRNFISNSVERDIDLKKEK